MRSGLQTPGAIPLLAVLVAALLSITPDLCEAWTKPGSSPPSIEYQTEPSRYQLESPSIVSPPTVVSAPSGISTYTDIDLLWQQVCQVTTSILSSYKHHSSDDTLAQQSPELTHNSSIPHPVTHGSTTITISPASIPRSASKQNSTPFSSAQKNTVRPSREKFARQLVQPCR